MSNRRAAILSLFASFFNYVEAFSFKFDNLPSQCGTVNISISGSGGTPPFRLGIVPWGGSPLKGGLEVRKILDLQFNNSKHISFTLPYPENSQFVAIVSDNNGSGSSFGSGGVTVPVSVTKSSSSSCLPTTQVHPDFLFGTDPLGVLTTCQSGFLTWDSSTTQGNVNFFGAIPGGQGFVVNGQSTMDKGQQALAWTPSIAVGTGVLVIAGDNRGFGSGGSFQGFLQPGNGTTSCLDGNSPQSTPGSPAGGSYPTNSSGGKTSGGGSGNNIGAIVGGVIGGVVGAVLICIIVFLLFRRRHNKYRAPGEPVDLLEGRDAEHGDGTHEDIPQQYLPEPYHIPASTRATTEMSETTSGLHPFSSTGRERRISQNSLTSQSRLSSEDMSTVPDRTTQRSAKSPLGPPTLRPVNIIQHEDAGPSGSREEEEEGEPETVELPPAYTNLRK